MGTSPMRRALVGQRDRSAARGFAFGLAFHQHRYPPLQPLNLARLAGGDVGQIVKRARQVRHGFFQMVQPLFHDAPRNTLPVQATLAAPLPIRYTPVRKR